MIALNGKVQILLCTTPTDMRRSFDGLSAQVKNVLQESPISGAVFVFINRRRTQMKCLYYEAGGYCLWSKRLEQGQFEMLGRSQDGKMVLRQTEFLSLIEGLELLIKKQRKRFKSAA